MKSNSLLIAGVVLFHLFIIDLTFFTVNPIFSQGIVALTVYNLIWLFIAVSIGTKYFHETKRN